ncbi:MAG: hypothetical protein NTW86_16085 [Candidatus Sumerlaeota bacterium]|nr:hypothetical protein [Candidatus Sumerlaeota bacterium]
MSLLTQAAVQTHRPGRLRATAVMGLVALTVAVTVLLLLHVQLRFTIEDLGAQSRALQKDRDRWISRRNQLISDLEELKNGDRVVQTAVEELHMVQCPPGRIDHLRLNPERVAAWREGTPKAKAPTASKPARQEVAATAAPKRRESLETLWETFRARWIDPPSKS